VNAILFTSPLYNGPSVVHVVAGDTKMKFEPELGGALSERGVEMKRCAITCLPIID
jgi:hypothetical protein